MHTVTLTKNKQLVVTVQSSKKRPLTEGKISGLTTAWSLIYPNHTITEYVGNKASVISKTSFARGQTINHIDKLLNKIDSLSWIIGKDKYLLFNNITDDFIIGFIIGFESAGLNFRDYVYGGPRTKDGPINIPKLFIPEKIANPPVVAVGAYYTDGYNVAAQDFV